MKPVAPEELVKWTASQAPTQVALTDLLQLFKAPPLSMSIRKVAIVFSAWDKVEDDNLTPDQYLASKLPLFDQYLQSATGSWDWENLRSQRSRY